MTNTFEFLIELKHNNNREWFNENKASYEEAKAEASEVFQQIFNEIDEIDKVDRFKIYRIYRDIRFSSDKTPYKTHLSAFIGRKQPHHRGGFYIHIEPNNCFIGGGFWGPEKDDLLRIRTAIAESDDLERILNQKELKENYGELYGLGLKTAPKGFPKDHERIELLRKKQFLLIKKFKDDEVFRPDFPQKVAEAYQILLPFFHYLTDVLTINENGEFIG